jgi:hypothetical protein
MSIFSKPVLGKENSVVMSLAAVGLVIAIYNASAGPVADVHATEAHDINMGKGIQKAGWVALAAVAGITLLGRDLNVAILGGGTIIAEEFVYHHAHMSNPGTGKLAPPPDQSSNYAPKV